MKRREFITLLGGTAAWPLAARAQQSGPMRRIGALTGIGDDQRAQARFAVFVQSLAQLGWIDGRNVRIDYRWGGGQFRRVFPSFVDIAADAPDVIFATDDEFELGRLLDRQGFAPFEILSTRSPARRNRSVVTARSISAASCTLIGTTSTPSDGAADWITANWPMPAVMAGSRSTAARVTRGAISLSRSSHFPLKLYSNCKNPVALRPGRDRLSTRPAPTGSGVIANRSAPHASP